MTKGEVHNKKHLYFERLWVGNVLIIFVLNFHFVCERFTFELLQQVCLTPQTQQFLQEKLMCTNSVNDFTSFVWTVILIYFNLIYLFM